MEIIFKLVLTAAASTVFVSSLSWIWTHQVDPKASANRLLSNFTSGPDWVATRDPVKLYQDGAIAGEVIGETTIEQNKIVFSMLANTSSLKLNQPFEYQRMKLLALSIKSSAGMFVTEKSSYKSVLFEVTCEVIVK